MENAEKEIVLAFNKKLTDEEYQAINNKIVQLPGITAISKHEDSMTICYNPYLLSENYLKQEMKKQGLSEPGQAKKLSKISRWLKNMAEANRKNLGSQPLDCCELKSKQN
ncbi:MAG TPA: LDCC motif putative metal-binding protein [Bacteroidales bacterium]|nr:LDCC motif putative metal-binding protein [Bacteroidales bacterium]